MRARGKTSACVLATALLLSVLAPVQAASQWSFAPVLGQLTSYFGWRSDPFNGGKRFHHGIDLAAPYGSPIYSTQPGIVTYSGPYKGYGNVAVIYHGGDLFTLYGHTSRLYVQRGQKIARGQMIAAVGSTGRSTGPHLHFEVHQNKKYVDPLNYLRYLSGSGYTPLQHSTARVVASRSGVTQTQVVYGTQQPGKVVARKGQQAAVGGGDVPTVAVALDEPEKPMLPTVIKVHNRAKPKMGKSMEVVSGTQVKTVKF